MLRVVGLAGLGLGWVGLGCVGLVRVRGEVGDVLVGVTSIFASGARARVKFFIFYFFHHGHPPYLSKNKKK